ncbi:MAG TPA: heparinase, partial [Myxococcota bacterium]|nr:heparinase [Myxococcota bacterium]
MSARAPSGLAWKLNRLRCMSPAEIGHRVARAATMRAERWGLLRCVVPAPDLACAPQAWVHAGARVDAAPYAAAAERIAAGIHDVFALEGAQLGSPPRWNRDPRTGVEAPLAFGKQLDYRDPAVVGDCKYLWEPNRHLHFVTLAQAWALTGEARHAEVLRAHLESWIEACPFRLGANWASALEPALR